MIEIYNKYNKLAVSFDKIDDVQRAIIRCNELKIKGYKIVVKIFQKIFTYYCASCKKRSYFENRDNIDQCQHCKDESNLFFVGIKQTDKFIEKVYYAN